eukprot:CAMPEP_0205895730 /NCGR_PEP_ID=MMETSP1083-20121108/24566_1 /ASSEMBLY_ACC=CAM_ASM_000430 /TAXON_ID=97485 /ORGANISM="Prymnesium parvum, Strain Texoma1" /LENGTH=406 /DNA_ID=CAMNT_0053260735 /DNA_START=183 /DNA_END=1400 /DNA_ORIENTATION=+
MCYGNCGLALQVAAVAAVLAFSLGLSGTRTSKCDAAASAACAGSFTFPREDSSPMWALVLDLCSSGAAAGAAAARPSEALLVAFTRGEPVGLIGLTFAPAALTPDPLLAASRLSFPPLRREGEVMTFFFLRGPLLFSGALPSLPSSSSALTLGELGESPEASERSSSLSLDALSDPLELCRAGAICAISALILSRIHEARARAAATTAVASAFIGRLDVELPHPLEEVGGEDAALLARGGGPRADDPRARVGAVLEHHFRQLRVKRDRSADGVQLLLVLHRLHLREQRTRRQRRESAELRRLLPPRRVDDRVLLHLLLHLRLILDEEGLHLREAQRAVAVAVHLEEELVDLFLSRDEPQPPRVLSELSLGDEAIAVGVPLLHQPLRVLLVRCKQSPHSRVGRERLL